MVYHIYKRLTFPIFTIVEVDWEMIRGKIHIYALLGLFLLGTLTLALTSEEKHVFSFPNMFILHPSSRKQSESFVERDSKFRKIGK